MKLKVLNWDGESEFDAEDTSKVYKERLEEQIERNKNNPKVTPEKIAKARYREDEHHDHRVNDMKVVDKLNKDLAVLVPSHPGHLPWLKPCLESIRKIGNYFTVLAWDDWFFKIKARDILRVFPSPETLALVDARTLKHRSYLPSVGISHFWNMLHGLKLLKGWGFKNVLAINGDCILEKPEGLPEMLEKFEGYDILVNFWWPERGQGWAGTMSLISKIEVIDDFYMSYAENMHRKLGTTEGRLGQFLMKGDYKVAPVVNPSKDNDRGGFKMPDEVGDWGRILGMRHLHAEHKVRRRLKDEPLEKRHYDFGPDNLYVRSPEMQLLVKYWETGDAKYKEQWWG